MNQHFQKAQLIAHTRPDVAVRELHAALAEEPDLAMAHSLLSMCFLDLGRINDAFESAHTAVRLDPQDGFSFYALARCHLHKAEFIEAEVAIDEALELEPFNESYLWLLALVQSHIGEFKEAKETLDRALECNPEHASSHSLRAYVLNRLDEKIESDKSSQLALSLTPDDAWSHNFRGWALIERKAYHEAMPHFREALRIDPTLSLARDGLIIAAPSQHWMFKLHLKLKNKSMYWIIPAWLIANFVLHVSNDHKNISALLAIYLSWFGLLSYLLVLFLPDSFISGPVLRFLLQFEQDGRYILSDEERRRNNHLVLFIVAIVAGLAIAIINQVWWPLGIALFMFWTTRLLVLDRFERDKKCYFFHAGGALISVIFVGAISMAGPNAFHGASMPGIILLQLGKVFGGGAIGAKLIAGGGAGAKLLIGGLGAGAMAVSAKKKKKEEAKRKMMGK